MRTILSTLALVALVTALFGASPAAQNRPKIPPPEFEREWELNEDGKRVWKEWEEKCTYCRGAKSFDCENCTDTDRKICLECDRTGRATCRHCAGTARTPDPLEEMRCPYC